jgi:hypothetical protein
VAPTLEHIRAACAPHGLNLVAAIPVSRYDAVAAPGYRAGEIDRDARTIVVIANGGGAFWAAYQQHAARNRGWLERDNPLDDFTRDVIEGEVAPVVRDSGRLCTVVYPFMSGGRTLNFIELGKVAGLAGPSILGVAVHPVYGPWIAFRAALLVDELIDAPGEAASFDPCPTCIPRSCIAACPDSAVEYPKGWNIPACLTHRVEVEPDCAPRCHSRAACVLGPEHRYPDDELAYHQMRALRSMRAYYEQHINPARR